MTSYPLASGWSMWRTLALRAAGFPARDVLALAAPETARALDTTSAALDALDVERAAAIASVVGALEARTEREQRGERRALATALRRLRAASLPETGLAFEPGVEAAVARVRSATTAYDVAREAAAAALELERVRLGEVLREHAREPRFREALAWQNRRALHTALEVMLRTPAGAATSKARQHEQLVANYLQRYCVKNDTIGFFGPVGWATVGDATTLAAGASLVARRSVYFEHWGIDVLARSLAQDPAVRPHVVPRRHPFVRLDNTTLHYPIARVSELPYEYACVLYACDGTRTARELAASLVDDPEIDVSSEAEVFEMLEELVAQRAVVWSIEVPTHVEHPERVLAEALERMPDRDAAANGLAILGELAAARDALAAAAGDAAAVDRALATLEERFTRYTEAGAQRRAGAMYAGRSLVYEDCRRDLALALDGAIIDRLRAPLSLLFTIARWFTFELAGRYRAAFRTIHAELGGERVDFLTFWERASDLFVGGRNAAPLIEGVVGDLQRRWGELLRADGTQRHIELASAALATRVAELFAAPHPGWPSARHHSPDLMIAARDVEALQRGEYELVLGELHVAVANLAPWILRQHPDPSELLATLDRERSWPVVEPVVSPERAGRADQFSLLSKDLALALASSGSTRPAESVLEPSDLVIEADGDSVRLATLDGTRHWPFEQAFDWFLTNDSAAHFRLHAPAPHTPRVSIDGVVVAREAWRFAAEDLAFARVEDPIDRLVAVRRWARAHGIPRSAFYKVPHETKPCYVDFDSPHFVEQLVHQARQAASLSISEMLPTVEQTWLPDASGERYASELRIVCCDPIAWSPAQRVDGGDP